MVSRRTSSGCQRPGRLPHFCDATDAGCIVLPGKPPPMLFSPDSESKCGAYLWHPSRARVHKPFTTTHYARRVTPTLRGRLKVARSRNRTRSSSRRRGGPLVLLWTRPSRAGSQLREKVGSGTSGGVTGVDVAALDCAMFVGPLFLLSRVASQVVPVVGPVLAATCTMASFSLSFWDLWTGVWRTHWHTGTH